jgi:hypothetical protein
MWTPFVCHPRLCVDEEFCLVNVTLMHNRNLLIVGNFNERASASFPTNKKKAIGLEAFEMSARLSILLRAMQLYQLTNLKLDLSEIINISD